MNFRRRVKLSRRKIRCSECKEVASRFKDVERVRVWFCADHFRERDLREKDGPQ